MKLILRLCVQDHCSLPTSRTRNIVCPWIMCNLDCQLGSIWNHLRDTSPGMSGKCFQGGLTERGGSLLSRQHLQFIAQIQRGLRNISHLPVLVLIHYCRYTSVSLASQCGLDTNCSPGSFQAFNTGLGLLRHPFLWTEQLTCSQPFSMLMGLVELSKATINYTNLINPFYDI